MNLANNGYCLLCAELKQSEKLIDLLQNDAARQVIVDKLLRVNAAVDFSINLPKTVCLPCKSNLDSAFQFVLGVEKAQCTLKTLFLSKQLKKEFEVSIDENGSDIIVEVPKSIKGEIEETEPIPNTETEEKTPDEYVNINVDDEEDCSDIIIEVPISIKGEIEDNTEPIPKTGTEEKVPDELYNDLNVENEEAIGSKAKSRNCPMRKTKLSGRKKDREVWSKNHPEIKEVRHKPTQKLKREQNVGNLNLGISPWKLFIWTCSYCESQFPTLQSLRSHSIEHHKVCNVYMCTKCRVRKYSLSKFVAHVRRHWPHIKLACYICHKSGFKSTKSCRVHESRHLEKKMLCEGCESVFYNPTYLENHAKSYYSRVAYCS